MASPVSVVAERQAANFQIAAGAQTAIPGVFICGRNLPFLDNRVLRCYKMRGSAKTNTLTTRPFSSHQTPPKICQGQGKV
jgi:hypothetical protein